MGMENPIEATLRAVDAVFSEGIGVAAISLDGNNVHPPRPHPIYLQGEQTTLAEVVRRLGARAA
jgi:hypothetical protein